MDIEREIMAWITRVDMFIISTWKFVLIIAVVCAIMMLAWTISDCVIKSQEDTNRRD